MSMDIEFEKIVGHKILMAAICTKNCENLKKRPHSIIILTIYKILYI